MGRRGSNAGPAPPLASAASSATIHAEAAQALQGPQVCRAPHLERANVISELGEGLHRGARQPLRHAGLQNGWEGVDGGTVAIQRACSPPAAAAGLPPRPDPSPPLCHIVVIPAAGEAANRVQGAALIGCMHWWSPHLHLYPAAAAAHTAHLRHEPLLVVLAALRPVAGLGGQQQEGRVGAWRQRPRRGGTCAKHVRVPCRPTPSPE